MERRPTDSRIDPGVFYISLAAPLLLVMIGICWSILKALREEELPSVVPEPERAAIRPTGTPAPQQTRGVDPEPRG